MAMELWGNMLMASEAQLMKIKIIQVSDLARTG